MLLKFGSEICDFQQQIGYSLFCAVDTPLEVLARSREFSGLSDLMASVESNFVQTTRVAMVTKI